MALAAKLVTVATTPTLLNSGQTDGVAGLSVAVKVPTGGVTVYIGGATITAAGATQGWPLIAGESLVLDLDSGAGESAAQDRSVEKVYAIVATGTQAVNVLARGV